MLKRSSESRSRDSARATFLVKRCRRSERGVDDATVIEADEAEDDEENDKVGDNALELAFSHLHLL